MSPRRKKHFCSQVESIWYRPIPRSMAALAWAAMDWATVVLRRLASLLGWPAAPLAASPAAIFCCSRSCVYFMAAFGTSMYERSKSSRAEPWWATRKNFSLLRHVNRTKIFDEPRAGRAWLAPKPPALIFLNQPEARAVLPYRLTWAKGGSCKRLHLIWCAVGALVCWPVPVGATIRPYLLLGISCA